MDIFTFKWQFYWWILFDKGKLECIYENIIHVFLKKNDPFVLKNHNDAFDRVHKNQIEYLNHENKLNANTNGSSKFAIFVLIVSIFAFGFYLVHVLYKRYLRLKQEQKFNSNYSNLIESEFDCNWFHLLPYIYCVHLFLIRSHLLVYKY